VSLLNDDDDDTLLKFHRTKSLLMKNMFMKTCAAL